MRWFKHDTDASTDAKLKKVKQRYGLTGFGLYWYCVEQIAGTVDKDNISFELEEDAETIAYEWRIEESQVQSILSYFCDLGLFEMVNNKITCLKLAKRLDDTNAKNPQIKELIKKLTSRKTQNNTEELPKAPEKIVETQMESEPLGETPNNSEEVRPDKIRLDKNRLDNKKPISGKAVDPPKNSDKIYAYCGSRIKLNQRDYDRFLKTYPNLDLVTELNQLDLELRDATNKSWYGALNAKLNYRNKKAGDRNAARNTSYQPNQPGQSTDIFDDPEFNRELGNAISNGGFG
ncbi:Lin1244/Lin1753 domain-containing protein [Sessilibacter corallicola]|uniref:Lin1244/Lin1753 domain-containing protein n=1 Tax=Sessilibacter corallicola TaxID=2904075 RepID=UPI001E4C1869|nr:DUF4373 domain-containing protein [Sessilibacter corallicola]